jgi:hypothetical protein
MKPAWPPEKTTIDELLKLGQIPETQREFLLWDLKFASGFYFRPDLPLAPRQAYEKAIKAAMLLKASMNMLSRYGVCLGGNWINAGMDKIIAEAEKDARKIQRGRPIKEGERSVVMRAVESLCLHAQPRVETRHLSPKQLQFIELFYETATGEKDARGKLDHQIRFATGYLPRAKRQKSAD